MPLTLINTPTLSLSTNGNVLSSLGWEGKVVPVEGLATAALSPDDCYLGVYKTPEQAVGQAISLETPIEQAMDEWLAGANALSGLARCNPGRVLLVEDRVLLNHKAEVEDELRARMPGQQLASEEDTSDDKFPLELDKPAASCLVIARQAVNASDLVQAAWAELRSLAWKPKAMANGLGSTAKLAGEEAIPLLEARIQDLEAELALVKGDKAELEQISNDILQQLFKVQEELESRILHNQGLREKARVADRDRLSAERRLHAVEHSLFWRISGPLRRLIALGLRLLRRVKRRMAR